MRESHRAGLYVATAAADRLDLFQGVELGEVQYVLSLVTTLVPAGVKRGRKKEADHRERWVVRFEQRHKVFGVHDVRGEEFDGGCGEDGGDGERWQEPHNTHAR